MIEWKRTTWINAMIYFYLWLNMIREKPFTYDHIILAMGLVMTAPRILAKGSWITVVAGASLDMAKRAPIDLPEAKADYNWNKKHENLGEY